jgi:hypothetical protein
MSANPKVTPIRPESPVHITELIYDFGQIKSLCFAAEQLLYNFETARDKSQFIEAVGDIIRIANASCGTFQEKLDAFDQQKV